MHLADRNRPFVPSRDDAEPECPAPALPASRRLSVLVLALAAFFGMVVPSGGGVSPAESSPIDVIEDPLGPLLAATPLDPDEEEALLDELRDAVREVRETESSTAVNLADSVLARIPTIQDWRPLIRAELMALAGDTAGVREALGQMDPATEFLERWGWKFHVDVLEEAGDTVRALGIARIIARDADSPDLAAAAWHRAGEIALSRGDSIEARDAFLSALSDGADRTGSRSAARALDRLHQAAAEGRANPGHRLDDEGLRRAVGRALLEAGSWERAHDHLAPFVDAAEGLGAGGDGASGDGMSGDEGASRPLSMADIAEIRIGLGRGLVELRRPDDATAMLAPLTSESTEIEHAAPALFWTGRAALADGDRAGAEAAFLELARRAPEHTLSEAGLLILLEDVAGRGGGARDLDRLTHELLRTGLGTSAAQLVVVRYGADQYLAGDFAAAATTFERYLVGSRRTVSRQQAGYWAALAHERLGDEPRARVHMERAYDEDPLSFYGIFAGERLGAPILPGSLGVGPPPASGVDREIANALTRLRVHQIVPTVGSFNHEMARLESYFFARGEGVYDFAEALIVGEFPIQGVVLGRSIHSREDEWNVRLLKIVHPFPHREAIVREARSRGLDPFFVAGLIRQESLFHASIESSAGAVGLMQLLPSTAQEVARSLGVRYSREQLSDPDYNIRLGTQFLSTMIRRFDGRAEDALSAYNAGPTRINQWRQRDAYRDRDVFMEHIPFQETRHYVKVVQQYTRIYTALYGCPGFEPCLGDSYQVAQARSPYAGGVPGSSLAR